MQQWFTMDALLMRSLQQHNCNGAPLFGFWVFRYGEELYEEENDAFIIDDRQHTRHGRIDQRNIGVRLRPERSRGAREELGVRGDLGMNFKADHDLPRAGHALYAVC